jgi:hypothetical protein
MRRIAEDPMIDRLSTIPMGTPNERALSYALHVHIESCEACGGPDDACEAGQALESICIDDFGFDPYTIINWLRGRPASKTEGVACACCGVSIDPDPPLCQDCVSTFTEYDDGASCCVHHERDAADRASEEK